MQLQGQQLGRPADDAAYVPHVEQVQVLPSWMRAWMRIRVWMQMRVWVRMWVWMQVQVRVRVRVRVRAAWT